jgi:hypothetical protein
LGQLNFTFSGGDSFTVEQERTKIVKTILFKDLYGSKHEGDSSAEHQAV